MRASSPVRSARCSASGPPLSLSMSRPRCFERSVSCLTRSRHSRIFGYERYVFGASFLSCVCESSFDFSSHHFQSFSVPRKSDPGTRNCACAWSAFSFSSTGRRFGSSQLIAATIGSAEGRVANCDAASSILARRGSTGIRASLWPIAVSAMSWSASWRIAPSSRSSLSPSRIIVGLGGSMKGKFSMFPSRRSSIVSITPASDDRSTSGGVYASRDSKSFSE